MTRTAVDQMKRLADGSVDMPANRMDQLFEQVGQPGQLKDQIVDQSQYPDDRPLLRSRRMRRGDGEEIAAARLERRPANAVHFQH